MSKVLITTPSFGKFSARASELLSERGLEIVHLEKSVTSDEGLLPLLDDVVAMIVGLEPITKRVIQAASALKVIGKHGVGVDNIDLETAKELGIPVVNAPGTNREAVADLVFGLMLVASRRILAADRAVRAGEWPKVFGHSVWGRTLGIVGLGAIGQSVAQRAKGFSMTTLAYDPWAGDETFSSLGVRRASLEEIFAESDYVTLHVPLNDQTTNLVTHKELKSMNPPLTSLILREVELFMRRICTMP